MKSFFTFFFGVLLALSSSAQTGIGTNSPDSHAMLDITSTQKGLLLPRLSTAQQAILSATLTGAQSGMLIADSANRKTYLLDRRSLGRCFRHDCRQQPAGGVSSTNNTSIRAQPSAISLPGTDSISEYAARTGFRQRRQPAAFSCAELLYRPCWLPAETAANPFCRRSVSLYSFGFPPKGWAFLQWAVAAYQSERRPLLPDRNVLWRQRHQQFPTPNLQGRVPLHFGNGSGLSPYTLGTDRGSEQNTITQ